MTAVQMTPEEVARRGTPDQQMMEQLRQKMLSDPRLAAILQEPQIQNNAPVNPVIPDLNQMAQNGQVGMEREGMFGIKGGFRDALGVLGDALITGFGRGDPIYRQQKEQEAIADTLLFAPGQAGKLASAGFGKEAYAVRQQDTANEVDRAKARSQAALDAIRAQEIQQKVTNGVRDHIAGILRTADEETYPSLLKLAKDAEARAKAQFPWLSLPWENLPDKFDPTFMAGLNSGGISPEEQAKLDETTRYHQATENLRGKEIKVKAALGAGDLAIKAGQLGVSAANTGVKAATSQANVEEKAKDRIRKQREAITKRMDQAVSDIAKRYPEANIRKNTITGEVQYSLDGRKTWKKAN